MPRENIVMSATIVEKIMMLCEITVLSCTHKTVCPFHAMLRRQGLRLHGCNLAL